MAQAGVSANRLELLQIADAVARDKSIDKQVVLTAMTPLFLIGFAIEWQVMRGRGRRDGGPRRERGRADVGRGPSSAPG